MSTTALKLTGREEWVRESESYQVSVSSSAAISPTKCTKELDWKGLFVGIEWQVGFWAIWVVEKVLVSHLASSVEPSALSWGANNAQSGSWDHLAGQVSFVFDD
jgi:hypothetical protein